MSKQIAKKIKAVVFDGDGVFFDSTVLVGKFYNPETKKTAVGEIAKRRSYYDGQGISFLRDAGLLVAFISSEASGFLESIGEKLNNLSTVKEGKWPKIDVFTGPAGKEKISTIDKWLKENNLNWSQVAYMGDDMSDYKILKKVKKAGGLTAAPAQAEKIIRDFVSFVTQRPGGFGAVRDLCNFILKTKGIDPTTLALR